MHAILRIMSRQPQKKTLCIIDKLLPVNPIDDAFDAVRDQMQCTVH